MRRALLLLLAVVSLSLMGAPRVSFIRPAHFWPEAEKYIIQVRVDKKAENRLLAVAAFDDSDPPIRVSYAETPLEGEQAAGVYRYEWYLPSGDLTLLAVLMGERGELARTSTPVSVQSKLP